MPFSDDEIQRMLDRGELILSGTHRPGESRIEWARRMLNANYPISARLSIDDMRTWPPEELRRLTSSKSPIRPDIEVEAEQDTLYEEPFLLAEIFEPDSDAYNNSTGTGWKLFVKPIDFMDSLRGLHYGRAVGRPVNQWINYQQFLPNIRPAGTQGHVRPAAHPRPSVLLVSRRLSYLRGLRGSPADRRED